MKHGLTAALWNLAGIKYLNAILGAKNPRMKAPKNGTKKWSPSMRLAAAAIITSMARQNAPANWKTIARIKCNLIGITEESSKMDRLQKSSLNKAYGDKPIGI
jgi:hypothetical protein